MVHFLYKFVPCLVYIVIYILYNLHGIYFCLHARKKNNFPIV